MGDDRPCLVTGATGYLGSRLVPALLAEGRRVRVLIRAPERVRDHPWAGDVEVAVGDVGDLRQVRDALEGVGVAYYLVHALETGRDFALRDRGLARTFAAAARDAGIDRIVYLGGLTPSEGRLSPHLRSRAEVGEILLRSGVPTAVLRAAVVLGAGSASFEMLRYLTERLPVMVTPTWVRTRIQPIAVKDVLHYLVGCADLPPQVNRTFDVGGPEVLTYVEMMQRYAAVAGLPRRIVLPVPVLTPRLSSLWVGVVTPVPAAVARPLVESLRNEVVCREHDIAAYVAEPDGGLTGFDEAVGLALRRVREAEVVALWSTAPGPRTPSAPLPTDPEWSGGSLYEDRRAATVAAPPAVLWQVVEGIGGEAGWYSFPLAWRVRGLVDRLSGGPGLRRGRRDRHRLHVGDTLDWWRVEALERGAVLRLRAEMRLPGLAWLELGVERRNARTVYTQRALFHPRGLTGQVYWWALLPAHRLVFAGMARGVARAAEEAARAMSGREPRPRRRHRPPTPRARLSSRASRRG